MSTTAAEATPANGARRRRFLTIFALVAGGGALLALLYYFFFLRGYLTTDNAYVNGNLVQATAQTAGTVVAVNADETTQVEAGAVLVNLDPVDAKLALARAENALATAVRQVRGQFAGIAGLDAALKARQAEVTRTTNDVQKARADLERRQGLQAEGAVSAEEVAHAQSTLSAAEAALAAAQAGVAEAGENRTVSKTRIAGRDVAGNPSVQQAAAEMKQAYIAFSRTRVVAPVGGVVARRAAQLGASVQPGQTLMSIVPLSELWVDANFKEAELAEVRIGQPVVLEADLYGGGVEYHGKIAGLSAGTGSAFSVLPAQNATGNWIKVVQRVPVRITLDAEELRKHPLRLGLSMSVRVDTRDTRGSTLAPASSAQYRTDVFAGAEAAAEERVQAVIAENLAAAGR